MKYVRLNGCTWLHKVATGGYTDWKTECADTPVGKHIGDHFTDTIPPDARLCKRCFTPEERAVEVYLARAILEKQKGE